jgi:predicted kinase
MRDRLKRPKKTSEDGKGEPGPAPLQPAYFDADGSSTAALAKGNEPGRVMPRAEETQAKPEETAEVSGVGPASPQRQGGSGDPRRRRRRGRGGRGRGGSRSPESAPSNHVPKEATSDGGQPAVASSLEALTAARTQPADARRAPKGSVILAIGLPGSGKSSWFKRHNIKPLSSDLLRALLFDDPTEQRFQDLIFSNLRSMLKARLIARRPLNYVDATNLTPHERQSWIKLAQDYGYEAQAVFFDVPLEVCLERNQRRQRVVTEDVMRRMSAKLRAPTFEEGFAKITVVKVKKKE